MVSVASICSVIPFPQAGGCVKAPKAVSSLRSAPQQSKRCGCLTFTLECFDNQARRDYCAFANEGKLMSRPGRLNGNDQTRDKEVLSAAGGGFRSRCRIDRAPTEAGRF